ncbi:MAG: hypothetical protein J5663_00090 [Bacteroidaceae bacterium]|nr:hypothetical protein [Bacteroidaceae bacterium]
MKKTKLLPFSIVAVLTMHCASGYAENDPVKYIDADGQEKYVTDYAVLNDDTYYLTSGWYVVNQKDFRNKRGLIVEGNVHIILCDDVVWTAPAVTYQYNFQRTFSTTKTDTKDNSSLSFYAQSTGDAMGRIVSDKESDKIYYQGFCHINSLIINGGCFDFENVAEKDATIFAQNFVMNGGRINISNAYKGISSHVLRLNGGEINVSSSSLGISAAQELTFGRSYCNLACNCSSFGYYGEDDIRMSDCVRVTMGGKEYLGSAPYNITDVENITKITSFYDEGIVSVEGVNVSREKPDVWYAMTGERLASKPEKRGVYICNGTKICVR